MRKSGSARQRPASGISWDEQNLQENEVIKATISKTKINEPKTPYHGPLDDQHMEDVDDGLPPLELDSHQHPHEESLGASSVSGTGDGLGSGAAAGTAGAGAEAVVADAPTAPDADEPVASLPGRSGPGGSTDSKDGHPHGQSHGHAGLHAHFDSSLVSTDAAAEPESRSGFSSDSERRASLTDGSDGEAEGEECRRKFEQRRRAHYNMRAALRRSRLLLCEDREGAPAGTENVDSGHASSDMDSDPAMDDEGLQGGNAGC